TDEEIDEQELEAHYSYMAKIQEELYGKEYLRKPTQTDVEKRYAFHEGKHAFPGSTDTKRIRYKQSHKATSKEVERALNVLKKKWAIRETLVRSQSRQTIAKLMYDLTEFMKIVQGVVLQFLWIGYLLLQNETLVCDYNSITLFDDIKAIVTTYNFKPRRKATDQDMDCKMLQGRCINPWAQISFQVTVSAAGTANITVKLPVNFNLLALGPGYTIRTAVVGKPIKFITRDGRRVTQTMMTRKRMYYQGRTTIN
nr:hypothetical protein [Tanacetum cinerariifolium]